MFKSGQKGRKRSFDTDWRHQQVLGRIYRHRNYLIVSRRTYAQESKVIRLADDLQNNPLSQYDIQNIHRTYQNQVDYE